MKTHSECPVCGNASFLDFIKTKDFFLTKEEFLVQRCTDCGLLLTNPYPDSTSIKKYYQSDEYYSHPNKRNSFIGNLYAFIKRINIKNKLRASVSDLKKGTILDIGCGSGDFLKAAQDDGWQVFGVEPNDEARTYAQKQLGNLVITPEQIKELKNQQFDVITLWHVLEHVEYLNEQVQDLHRLLKPGGRLVIALPNIKSYDALNYKEFWAAYDVPRHLYHFSFETIQLFMQRNHFKYLHREPLKWDAYYISMLSERYKGNPLGVFSALLIGFISNFLALRTREYSSNIYIFST